MIFSDEDVRDELLLAAAELDIHLFGQHELGVVTEQEARDAHSVNRLLACQARLAQGESWSWWSWAR